jgi:glutamate synthase (NADPH/NADH) small chain
VQVGADLSSRYLQGRYAGMCFCGGARAPRDLRVPGRELGGIHFAMDYLVRQNKRLTGEANDPAGELSAAGKRVVILGGGDTGADCLGTALRQAALSVTQLEILPEPPAARSPDTPWPMWPHKRRDSSSHHEGGARRWGVTTRAFKGASGRVCALQCVAVEWDKDDTGRPRMRTQAGSEFEVAADLVLLALGFAGPQPNRVLDDLGAEKDSRGLVRRNADGMTTVPGVFIAGDMYLGPSLMVRAMADGRRVGEGLARYLDGV